MVSKETLILLAKLSMIAVTLLGLTACRSVMQASDIYVAQNATGANNGHDCADAHDTSFFNNGGNWGSGAPIGPGTTVHLCGKITGSTNSDVLVAQGSGTSGNPITILWEAGAQVSSPACNYCFNTNRNTFLVLDGNGTNPSITSTNNGSSAGGFANSISTNGINAAGCSNCEFRNLTITNMYVFTDPNNDHNGSGGGIGISGSSNIKIHDCTFDQMNGPVWDGFGNGDTNISIYKNTFDHFNHGIEIGNNNSNVISNVFIYGNHFKNMVTWDSSANNYHHDGIFFYQNTEVANTVRNFYLYDNLFDGDLGVNATAWIYYNSGLNGIYVFNNKMFNPGARSVALLESGYPNTGDQNNFIYNNYFQCNVQGRAVQASGFTNYTLENNAMDACSVYFFGENSLNLGSGKIDHNVYGGATPGNDSLFKWNNTYISLTALRALGIDVNSLTPTSTGVNSTGIPQAGSAVIHNDATNFANLDSSCAGNLAPLCTDFAGVARPASGSNNWDAGAYSFSSLAPINPPTNLSAGIH